MKQIDDQISQLNQKLNKTKIVEEREECENQLKTLKLEKSKYIAEYKSKSQEEIKQS